MTRITRRFRPSPALVIGCMALFLALTGSALAVGKNAVRSAQIVNGQVKTADLGRDAVRSGKIANETVAAADLRADSVKSDEIARDAVGPDEIAENAVSSPEVAPESLTSSDLGTSSVGSSEVANESLAAADLGPDSVGASELADVTVRTNSEPIAAGATGAITANCLAGEQVISGGGQPGHYGVETTGTRPSGNGWRFLAKNDNGSASTITAYAVCLG